MDAGARFIDAMGFGLARTGAFSTRNTLAGLLVDAQALKFISRDDGDALNTLMRLAVSKRIAQKLEQQFVEEVADKLQSQFSGGDSVAEAFDQFLMTT